MESPLLAVAIGCLQSVRFVSNTPAGLLEPRKSAWSGWQWVTKLESVAELFIKSLTYLPQSKRLKRNVFVGMLWKLRRTEMKTIWKYTLEITDQQFVEVPDGSELLTVQMQNGTPQLWVKCYSENPKISKRIRIYGTGHKLWVDDETYLATFQVCDGDLVFHVFVGN
jgi:hypothetical protein